MARRLGGTHLALLLVVLAAVFLSADGWALPALPALPALAIPGLSAPHIWQPPTPEPCSFWRAIRESLAAKFTVGTRECILGYCCEMVCSCWPHRHGMEISSQDACSLAIEVRPSEFREAQEVPSLRLITQIHFEVNRSSPRQNFRHGFGWDSFSTMPRIYRTSRKTRPW